ncbi:MAG TPA: hypothetical protein IAC65_02530 [Candidatus Aphodousia faecipullorum]|nr:hypothetical protein [Candidatus Aphodousia faecipullorum]
MANELERQMAMVNLDDPAMLASFFDAFLDNLLEVFNESKDSEELMSHTSEAILFMTAVFKGSVPNCLVSKQNSGKPLGRRLGKALRGRYQDKVDLFSTVEHPVGFIPVAFSLMIQEFFNIYVSCGEQNVSQEVFNLQRDALVADWVRYFLGNA